MLTSLTLTGEMEKVSPISVILVGGNIYERNGWAYRIQYKVIRLIEIEGQPILDAQDPGLLPFTPLMKRREGVGDNRWLDECIDAPSSVTLDVPRRDILLSALGIFGGLVYDYEYIKQRIPKHIIEEHYARISFSPTLYSTS